MRKITLRKLALSAALCLLTFLVLHAQNGYPIVDDFSYYDEIEWNANNSSSAYYETTLSKNEYFAPDIFVKEVKKTSKKKKLKKSPFRALPNFDITVNPNRGKMNLFVQLQSPHLGVMDVELIDKKGNVVKQMQLDCANEDCLEIALQYQKEGKYKLKFYVGGDDRKLVKAFKVFKYDGWFYA